MNDREELKTHMREKHLTHKNHECSICNRVFRESGHLSRHLVIHTGMSIHNYVFGMLLF